MHRKGMMTLLIWVTWLKLNFDLFVLFCLVLEFLSFVLGFFWYNIANLNDLSNTIYICFVFGF